MGVETIYKPDKKLFIKMKFLFKIILYYLLITVNSNVLALDNSSKDILKIGILAPLSGDLKSLGETILYSTNLALQDIDDDSVKIYPKDSGTNKDSMIKACEEFREEGIKIIIGPIDSAFLKELKKFEDLVFLSLIHI